MREARKELETLASLMLRNLNSDLRSDILKKVSDIVAIEKSILKKCDIEMWDTLLRGLPAHLRRTEKVFYHN